MNQRRVFVMVPLNEDTRPRRESSRDRALEVTSTFVIVKRMIDDKRIAQKP